MKNIRDSSSSNPGFGSLFFFPLTLKEILVDLAWRGKFIFFFIYNFHSNTSNQAGYVTAPSFSFEEFFLFTFNFFPIAGI